MSDGYSIATVDRPVCMSTEPGRAWEVDRQLDDVERSCHISKPISIATPRGQLTPFHGEPHGIRRRGTLP